MKPFLYFILFVFVGWNPPLPDQPQRMANIARAEISFEFVSKGVDGTIGGFQSNSNIDWEHPENSHFEGSVSVSTLDTHNGLRNWSLKNRKYFNADEHPKIHFKSNGVTSKDGLLNVSGTLTIKGISKPISIKFKKKGQQLVGTTSLYTSDFGIPIKKNRDDNLVTVHMVFETSQISNR